MAASRIGTLTFDCRDPKLLAGFWCAALGFEEYDADETGVAVRDPSGTELPERPFGAPEHFALGKCLISGRRGIFDAVAPAEDERLCAQIEPIKPQAPEQEPEFGGHGNMARPPLTVMVVPVE